MRESYGKLMYFAQDSRKPDVRDLLEFDTVVRVRTVFDVLRKSPRGLDMLEDHKGLSSEFPKEDQRVCPQWEIHGRSDFFIVNSVPYRIVTKNLSEVTQIMDTPPLLVPFLVCSRKVVQKRKEGSLGDVLLTVLFLMVEESKRKICPETLVRA